MTKEIIAYEKKITPIVAEAQSLAIATQEDMTRATEVLSTLNKWNDTIIAEKEKVTVPLNEALKAERARWKPLESMYETAIASIRSKMSAWQTAEMKRAKEEADKVAARIGEGKGKLKLETAVNKLNAIEKPEEAVTTNAGMVKFRETKVLKVTDALKIPREFLMIDERKLLDALKAGAKVAGAELETVQVPMNYR